MARYQLNNRPGLVTRVLPAAAILAFMFMGYKYYSLSELHRTSVSDSEAAQKAMSDQISEVKARLERKNSELEELSDINAKCKNDKKSIETSAERLKELSSQKNEELQRTIASCQSSVRTMEEESQEAEDHIHQLQQDLENTQDELSVQKEALQEKSDHYTQLEDELETLQKSHQELQQTHQGLQENHGTLQDDMAKREEACQKLASSLDQAVQEQKEFKSKFNQCEASKEELKANMQEDLKVNVHADHHEKAPKSKGDKEVKHIPGADDIDVEEILGKKNPIAKPPGQNDALAVPHEDAGSHIIARPPGPGADEDHEKALGMLNDAQEQQRPNQEEVDMFEESPGGEEGQEELAKDEIEEHHKIMLGEDGHGIQLQDGHDDADMNHNDGAQSKAYLGKPEEDVADEVRHQVDGHIEGEEGGMHGEAEEQQRQEEYGEKRRNERGIEVAAENDPLEDDHAAYDEEEEQDNGEDLQKALQDGFEGGEGHEDEEQQLQDGDNSYNHEVETDHMQDNHGEDEGDLAGAFDDVAGNHLEEDEEESPENDDIFVNNHHTETQAQ